MRPSVLICGPSRDAATRLGAVLEQHAGLAVVGISPTGEHALRALGRLRPAIVAIDLELPGSDGLRTIEAIASAQTAAVIALTDAGGDEHAAAFRAGALDVWPRSFPGPEARRRCAALARRLDRTRAPRPAARREALAIGVGASTGGPKALRAALAGLPAAYAVPVLVVQHMSDGFIAGLADWLDEQIAPPVRVAEDGAPLAPGVWLAPTGAHLSVDRECRTVLSRGAPVAGHRPSVDVLLTSLARVGGARSVAVLLTGMGRDGADGVAAVLAAGGLALAQDEASAAVFGMPQMAAARGARTLTPEAIGALLRDVRPARRPA